MKETLLFPTVIHEYDFSGDPDLEKIVKISETIDFKQHRYSPNSTYVGNKPGGILDHPELNVIRDKLNICVAKWADNMGCPPIHINHNWLNRLAGGERVERHRHEMSIASGSFYIHADPGSAGLIVHSPLEQLRMFEQSARNTWYNENFREFPCYSGLLLIFPAWLPHDTLPNNSNNRLVLSFNTTYK